MTVATTPVLQTVYTCSYKTFIRPFFLFFLLLAGFQPTLLAHSSSVTTPIIDLCFGTPHDVWPNPCFVNQGTLDSTKINDAAHTVEGKFYLTSTGIRTEKPDLADSEPPDIFLPTPGALTTTGLVSDDFCDGTLGSQWTFVDPQSDGTLSFSGSGTANAWVNISVPGESSHELWEDGIQAPHILQSANNVDMELIVKMESPVNAPQYQEQGILIKQDDFNFLRFEIYSSNTNTKIIGGIMSGTSIPLNTSLPINNNILPLNVAPIWMKVVRNGNSWTQSYSTDGVNYTVVGTVTPTFTLIVTGVGIYGGNAIGSGSPEHTAKFDYFESSDDPIVNEDNCTVLPITLHSFTATPKSNVTQLHWRTVTELNNDYMAVEHSTDGRRYAEIGRVPGAGTTQEPQDYRFTHEAPTAGLNYYRLRQVDYDGQYEYHGPVTVRFGKGKATLALYPTATSDELTVAYDGQMDADATLSLQSTDGRLLRAWAWNSKSGQRTTFSVADLPAGWYVLRLRNGREVLEGRFLKQ